MIWNKRNELKIIRGSVPTIFGYVACVFLCWVPENVSNRANARSTLLCPPTAKPEVNSQQLEPIWGSLHTGVLLNFGMQSSTCLIRTLNSNVWKLGRSRITGAQKWRAPIITLWLCYAMLCHGLRGSAQKFDSHFEWFNSFSPFHFCEFYFLFWVALAPFWAISVDLDNYLGGFG